MEPHDQSPEIDPVMREAIAWVVLLKSGEATVSDAEALTAWRAQSDQHSAAFARAVRLWRSFEAAASEDRTSERSVRTGVDRVASRRIFLGGLTAAAAAACGFMIVRPPLGLWPSLQELTADYRTGKGQQLRVALNKGVAIDLGTLTSIAVQSVNEVRLIDGEAAITASTPTGHNLSVLAGNGRIVATDADFDARCIDGVVSVTCVRGAVRVDRPGSSVRLAAGERTTYTGAAPADVSTVDLQQATSWREGVLIFKNRPLAEVVDEINRYRPGRIFIASIALRSRIVDGAFHRDRLDNFVDQVRQLFGAKVTLLPADVVLLS